MKFGEKIKKARTALGISQEEFARAIGVSLRTVTNYETGDRHPKKRGLYFKMAEVLNVDVNYLLTDDEAFLLDASGRYGSSGSRQAQELIAEVSGLFAGGEMAQEDMDIMMHAIQEAYWQAKENNKKFRPKKYRSE
ncbi:MAG: helix-turn-helix transcriptional regulator [Oscillospiraceae bacterium]|nr:helix-turn-helix transcriptional regulator [Oscillospiraceae bacterium]